MKLLIVDDNSDIRKIIRHTLTGKFEKMFEAADGLEAFKSYEANQPDWVIMDLEMPGVDGLTGIKMIKNKFPAARILMVSKFTDKEIVELSKYVGAEAYFFKDDLMQIDSFFSLRK